MDALSEALTSIRMTGAIFFHAECTEPWGISFPPLKGYAHLLAPGTERLLSYHLVSEGSATAGICGAELEVSAGDLLIIPHGDPHVMSGGGCGRLVSAGSLLKPCLSGELSRVRIGGGGVVTRIICGFFGCDHRADRSFLGGLPPFIRIPVREDPTGLWIERTIRYLVGEAGSDHPGRSILLSKMAEALFIEALRRYMAGLPPGLTGWLPAARDPVVGAAIAAMHRDPAHRWTLEELAGLAASSRSVLVSRFGRYLGISPLAYLSSWRMQVAEQSLLTSRDPIVQIGQEIGYESEAAFIRAFKRQFGQSPARYRKSRASSDAAA